MFDLEKAIEKIKSIEASGQIKHSSEFYGINDVVLSYLNLPKWFPLKFIAYIEHGYYYFDFFFDRLQQLNGAEAYLASNTFRYNFIKSKIDSPCYILGNPFVLYKRHHNIKLSETAEGTIVFPSHSTHHLALTIDWEEYAGFLESLPQEMKPITVCIYWKDLLNNDYQILKNRGFDVITNGHIFDKNFISNFYENIKNFKYCIGNQFGSNLIYAYDLGLSVFMTGPKSYHLDANTPYKPQTNFQLDDMTTSLHWDIGEPPIMPAKAHEVCQMLIDEASWHPPQVIKNQLIRLAPMLIIKKIAKYIKLRLT
jgi:hypothetical protein